jgi:nitroreductase
VRKYHANLPVEAEKLHALLEMACAAPSAGDLQSYRIIVVQDAETRAALRQTADDQDFIEQAPVCLVFCADASRASSKFGTRGASLYALQDATIAAAYSQLATVAAGMASTWIGRFDEQRIRDLLELPETLTPVALISIGYPDELPEPTSRRPLDEVVEYR